MYNEHKHIYVAARTFGRSEAIILIAPFVYMDHTHNAQKAIYFDGLLLDLYSYVMHTCWVSVNTYTHQILRFCFFQIALDTRFSVYRLKRRISDRDLIHDARIDKEQQTHILVEGAYPCVNKTFIGLDYNFCLVMV